MATGSTPKTELLHYRIHEKIGGGGMGEVYLAEDTRLGRKVAIKFLSDEFSRDPDKLNRFVREAKAASALNHPNILTVYEIGEADGQNYIATEYIEGKTLRDHIVPDSPLDVGTSLTFAIQIAEALAAAHAAGIIHRDIKPENVMVRADGYLKLLDFGIAKLAEAHQDEVDSEETTLVHTTPGLVIGTVAYMSPEQARGRGVDTRTDIFSLGVVIFELLTGRQPFTGDTPSHAIVAILEKEPPSFASLGLKAPADVEAIVKRSLEKRPEDRYQSAAEIAADLGTVRKRLDFQAQLQSDETSTKTFDAGKLNGEPANTIAVMPFVNMSRDENGDYFSDGLAEELLNVLSKIRGLRVAARTSAFSFKGKAATIGEIGHALNVASVLEGSIRTAGERVRIAVQLVKVSDGYQMWSETYDRMMDDIFAVQDDIAQSVVEELRSRLLGEPKNADDASIVSEVADAVKGRADDPEAQRLMLLGRHFLDRTTREDTAKAIGYFRQALDIDPEYALCWAELGRAFSVEAGRGWVPMKEGYSRVREAIDRALALEPDLAEGYAILERIQDTYEWDWKAAEASMRRAMELAPGSSAVLDRASVLAYKMGRLDEAIALGRRVLEQDPLSAAFWHNLGLTCHAAGQLDESANAFRRALELAPQRFVSAALLALVMADQGKVDEALVQAQAEPDEFWRLWAVAIINNAAGRAADSDAALNVLVREHAEGNTFQLAEVHAMQGEEDQAFEWLGRAINERDPGVTHSKVNPRFRPLYGDPRWVDLLKKIGFEG